MKSKQYTRVLEEELLHKIKLLETELSYDSKQNDVKQPSEDSVNLSNNHTFRISEESENESHASTVKFLNKFLSFGGVKINSLSCGSYEGKRKELIAEGKDGLESQLDQKSCYSGFTYRSRMLNDDIRIEEHYIKKMIQEKEQKFKQGINSYELSLQKNQADKLKTRLRTSQIQGKRFEENAINKIVHGDNFARRTTGFGIYDDYEVDKENNRLKKEKYKLELDAQIDENRRLKQLEKQKYLLEEKLEEQKRMEDQRRLQQRYDEEQAAQNRKLHEAEIKREHFLKLHYEYILEEKERQLKEKEERLRQKQVTCHLPTHMIPSQGLQSPFVSVTKATTAIGHQPHERVSSQDNELKDIWEITKNINATQKGEVFPDDKEEDYVILSRKVVQKDSGYGNNCHIVIVCGY